MNLNINFIGKLPSDGIRILCFISESISRICLKYQDKVLTLARVENCFVFFARIDMFVKENWSVGSRCSVGLKTRREQI